MSHADVRTEEQRLLGLLRSGNHSAFRRELQAALAMHPAEPSLTLLAGAHELRSGSPTAGRWINRTMMLAPNWAAPHLEAARWLSERGLPRQADLEFREAATKDLRTARRPLCEAAQGRTKSGVRSLLPREEPQRRATLAALGECARGETGTLVDELLVEDYQDACPAYRRLGRRALSRGRPLDAIHSFRQALDCDPEDMDSVAGLATARSRSGAPKEALEMLERGLEASSEDRGLLEAVARIRGRIGDIGGMRAALSRLRDVQPVDGQKIARTLLVASELEERFGDLPRALHAAEKAQGYAPGAKALLRIGRLAQKLGRFRRAYTAYSELCAHPDGGREWCRARDRLLAGDDRPAVVP